MASMWVIFAARSHCYISRTYKRVRFLRNGLSSSEFSISAEPNRGGCSTFGEEKSLKDTNSYNFFIPGLVLMLFIE